MKRSLFPLEMLGSLAFGPIPRQALGLQMICRRSFCCIRVGAIFTATTRLHAVVPGGNFGTAQEQTGARAVVPF